MSPLYEALHGGQRESHSRHAHLAGIFACASLLQPCLGGNSCTAIIATINPSHHHVEETVNTLTFATRAMAVTNVVTANSNTPTPGRLQRVTARAAEQNALIAELRSQVTALQLQLRQAQAAIAHAALTPHPPPPAHTSPPGAHTSGRSARQQQQAQGHNQEGKSSRTNGGQQQQQGGANAAGDQQQQAPPVPSLSEKQAAALSKRWVFWGATLLLLAQARHLTKHVCSQYRRVELVLPARGVAVTAASSHCHRLIGSLCAEELAQLTAACQSCLQLLVNPPPVLLGSHRLDELEGDKAVLLDRLEALTGQPQGWCDHAAVRVMPCMTMFPWRG
jgi:hypothetical protein